MTEQTQWTDYTPQQAKEQELDLSKRLDITAPLNEEGERCPWPWDPQQLVNAPLGQYHCPYCMAMVVAGMPHIDYKPQEWVITADNWAEVKKKLGGEEIAERPGCMLIDTPWGPIWIGLGDLIRIDGYGFPTVTAAEPHE